MDTRYWLVIESGARRGERVPVPASGLRVGRRGDSDLVLADASVSGQHAEINVDAAGALLRDLGSRNGTHVGGQRVSEAALEHRAKLRFGAVEATFVDGEAEAPLLEDAAAPGAPTPALGAAAAAAGAPAAAGDGGGVQRASRGRIEASARRSPSWTIAAAAAVVAACALGWWTFRRGARASGRGSRIEAPPGNLLAGHYSFEAPASEAPAGASNPPGPSSADADPLAHWTSDDAAPAGFGPGEAASSGRAGVSAALAAGEWAQLASDPVGLRSPGLIASAMLRGPGEARLGLELASSTGLEPELVLWSAAVSGAGFEPAALSAPALPGYDRARVLVRGTGPGEVSCDDVSAIPGAPAARRIEAAGASFHLLGASGEQAALARLGATALKALACFDAEGRALAPAAAAAERGFSVAWPAGAARASFVIDREIAQAALATVGAGPAGGYRAEGARFSAAAARAIVCGAGPALMRLEFDPPAALEGVAGPRGYAVDVELAGAGSLAIQLDFKGEQALGQELAARARDSERGGARGAALAAWGELLARAPYDPALVRQAEEARARLERVGLAELAALAASAERAQFFGVPRMLESARRDALGFAASYSGAPFAADAVALAEGLSARLSAGAADAGLGEDARLAAVRDALATSGQPGLAALIERALAERAAALGAPALPPSDGAPLEADAPQPGGG